MRPMLETKESVANLAVERDAVQAAFLRSARPALRPSPSRYAAIAEFCGFHAIS